MDHSALKDIKWDFRGAKTESYTHGMHPYPAKFIPQIPRALIENLSVPGDTVADVFCGSGTTLVEAMLCGRNAIGVDANPLACLISRAKTALVDEMGFTELERLSEATSSLKTSLSSDTSRSFRSKSWRPIQEEDLKFWFKDFIIEELAETLGECRSIQTPEARDIALTAFSSIVVACSNQDSDTRYVRREKSLRPGDVSARFATALRRGINGSQAFFSAVPKGTWCKIFSASVLDGPQIPPVDLMVCSPPYPNAYSYHLYHRTRMLWLGMDDKKFKVEEIGSHRKYSSHAASGATVETFRREMTTMLVWLRQHLSQTGEVCVVLGDSTIRGEHVDNAELLAEVAQETGYAVLDRFERVIDPRKKSFNPRIGRIKEEHIMVLVRQA